MESAARSQDILKAGTGFMTSVSESIRQLVSQGYTENLSARVDHFECCSGSHKIYPQDVRVDKMLRFENASDPDDQSIIYAISSIKDGLKGIYVEAYGIYQDEVSKDMLERLKNHLH